MNMAADQASIEAIAGSTAHKEFRIVGPPGCGKSTTIRHWAAKAVDRYGSDGVMVTSFSRAAAMEIASRGLAVDRQMVGTLHSMALRAIGKPTIAETRIDEWNATHPAYRLTPSASRDINTPARASNDGKTPGDKLMEQAQRLRKLMTPHASWPSHVMLFEKRWREWKDEHEFVDFTGLLEVALETIPVAPGAPSVLFVDEAQDLGVLELALVRSWMSQTEFGVLVFDTDQTIYSFTGASPEALLAQDVPPENVRVLSQSYRIPRVVHEFAVKWIEQSSFRYPSVYNPREEEGELHRIGATFQNPNALVADVAKAKGTTMILASCSYMLAPTIKRLRSQGIPFQNKGQATNGSWNPMRGVPKVLAFLAPDPRLATPDRPNRLWTYAEARAWVALIRSAGVLKRGAKAEIGRQRDARKGTDAALTPITPDELRELFEPEALGELTAAFTDGTATTWLARSSLAQHTKRLRFYDAVARNRGVNALLEEPSVTVGTLHSSKGCEADEVHIFPDLSQSGFAEWRGTPQQRDTIRRLFYVGATRARRRLVLAKPATPMTIRW